MQFKQFVTEVLSNFATKFAIAVVDGVQYLVKKLEIASLVH